MDDPLLLSPAERRAALRAAGEASERLRARRAADGIHAPAPAELLEAARAMPGPGPSPLSEVLDRFVALAAGGWDKTSGGNLSFIPNGALDIGAAAALLATAADSFTGTSFEAPAMVAMEEGVLRWMADLLGLPGTAGGLLLSGGSLANQTAVVAARERVSDPARATMVVSERVHHSVTKAAHLAGIADERVRIVPVDADGRCDVAALDATIARDSAAGLAPFLVVGVAGSTDTGSIDPLGPLADVAAAAHAWFHVDAAYGAFFALTARSRQRLAGIERADSVTLDAHKGLFLPYGVGALLCRDPDDLVAAHEAHGAYFRGLPSVEGLPHYCQRGPELTRPSRAPLAWIPLHLHGTAAFAATLDRMLDLAVVAHERLAAIPGVVPGPRPQLSIATFRAAAGDGATDAVVAALHASGRFQVSTTTLDGQAFVRLAFLNPRTTETVLLDALDVIRGAIAAPR